jgi:AraC-like DNA-binding protein
MNKAQQLLANTDMNLQDIARQVGYDDPYTFSRAFKNTIGISPQFYRKNLGNIF